LNELRIRLNIVLIHKENTKEHEGIEASSRTLFLYGSDPNQAWETLMHEAPLNGNLNVSPEFTEPS